SRGRSQQRAECSHQFDVTAAHTSQRVQRQQDGKPHRGAGCGPRQRVPSAADGHQHGGDHCCAGQPVGHTPGAKILRGGEDTQHERDGPLRCHGTASIAFRHSIRTGPSRPQGESCPTTDVSRTKSTASPSRYTSLQPGSRSKTEASAHSRGSRAAPNPYLSSNSRQLPSAPERLRYSAPSSAPKKSLRPSKNTRWLG